jgi:hypothetical protein
VVAVSLRSTGRFQLKTKGAKAADFKKAAAGDKPEPSGNGKVEKSKVVKIQTFTPANAKLVKRGFATSRTRIVLTKLRTGLTLTSSGIGSRE